MKFLASAIITMMLLVSGCASTSTQHSFEPDYSDTAAMKIELKKTINTMIKELEADDKESTEQFFTKYLPIKELETLKQSEGWDKIIEKFLKKKREPLQKALKYIVDKEPTITDDGKTYSFDVSESSEELPNRPLIFIYSEDKKSFIVNN